MKTVKFTKNHFGISIKMCCASCAYKEQSRLITKRGCAKHGREVRPCYLCDCWKMDEKTKAAGKSRGRVKRKEYLDFFRQVRIDEEKCHHCAPLTTEEVRNLFERLFGNSIYIFF
ncbi:hypothetical protein [Xylanibacter ruminicola]|uniref:Uncharacterized protein n=1 Tax=Xylanibacter ruminicola TaxID=839 RepID=A0A1M6Z9S3_XYLRU|nr:hypothetical protein [Xylanibacter ruminicola]SHL27198.1 hypothetical protein SAMN05216463_1456 [Xylanibacter ruminicola]